MLVLFNDTQFLFIEWLIRSVRYVGRKCEILDFFYKERISKQNLFASLK